MTTIEEDVQVAFSWFDEHLPLLDLSISQYKDNTDDIKNINIYGDNEIIYNIQGQKVIKPSNGIYIKKGKKYIFP